MIANFLMTERQRVVRLAHREGVREAVGQLHAIERRELVIRVGHPHRLRRLRAVDEEQEGAEPVAARVVVHIS